MDFITENADNSEQLEAKLGIVQEVRYVAVNHNVMKVDKDELRKEQKEARRIVKQFEKERK